jgi:hypothetical protein
MTHRNLPELATRAIDAVRDPARRGALLAVLLAYPAVRLRLRLWGVGRTMRWACRQRDGRVRDPDIAAWAVDRLVREGRLHGRCLVRSQVLARVLSQGYAPAVKIGVRRVNGRTEAHAWVEVDGRTFGQLPEFPPLQPGRRRTVGDGGVPITSDLP